LIPVGFPNGNYCEDYSANGFLAHSRFIVNSSGGTVFFTKSNHMGTPALICLKLQGEVQKATSTVYESPKRSWGKKTV
jgi:hypothetical protein